MDIIFQPGIGSYGFRCGSRDQQSAQACIHSIPILKKQPQTSHTLRTFSLCLEELRLAPQGGGGCYYLRSGLVHINVPIGIIIKCCGC